jgi:hypothetical protein
MAAESTIRDYYASLRAGDPLAPYFAEDNSLVKVGISERLRGYEAVRSGLSTQTASTEEWVVESGDLQVTEREGYAWFSDAVWMAWTDTETGTRHGFDSRWSGTLEDREDWVVVGMHVSAPREL